MKKAILVMFISGLFFMSCGSGNETDERLEKATNAYIEAYCKGDENEIMLAETALDGVFSDMKETHGASDEEIVEAKKKAQELIEKGIKECE